LAAHEDKINHRVANLEKIKVRWGAMDHICVLMHDLQAELDVDTFLLNNDSRMMAEG
jgi:hypothetical protein